MRYLAIDLGDKRTGLAVGDDVTGIVSPLDVVEVPLEREGGAALLEALAARVQEQWGEARRHEGTEAQRGELVLGLPLNMDGSEGPRAKLVRAFAERLRERIGLRVHLHDERQTTDEAHRVISEWARFGARASRKQRKQQRDAIAATIILEDFLRARKGDR